MATFIDNGTGGTPAGITPVTPHIPKLPKAKKPKKPKKQAHKVSKVPFVHAKHKNKKAKKPKKAKPFDPLAPLTGKAFDNTVNNQTNMIYQPQERASQQLQANIPGWYQSYIQQNNASATAVNNAYSQGQQSVYNQANTMQAQNQQNAQVQQQQSQQQADTRGATVDPNVAATAQQAGAARQALASSFGGMLATQGAARTAQFQDQARIGAGAQVQAQTSEANRYRGILKEKGQYKAKARSDLQASERTWAANQAAFNINASRAAETGRHNRVTEHRSAQQLKALKQDRKAHRKIDWATVHQRDRKFQQDERKFGHVKAKDRYLRDHKLGPFRPPAPKKSGSKSGGKSGSGSGLTPTQKRAKGKNYDKAVSLVRSGKGFPGGLMTHKGRLATLDGLIKKGIDRDNARKAIHRLYRHSRRQGFGPSGPGTEH